MKLGEPDGGDRHRARAERFQLACGQTGYGRLAGWIDGYAGPVVGDLDLTLEFRGHIIPARDQDALF